MCLFSTTMNTLAVQNPRGSSRRRGRNQRAYDPYGFSGSNNFMDDSEDDENSDDDEDSELWVLECEEEGGQQYLVMVAEEDAPAPSEAGDGVSVCSRLLSKGWQSMGKLLNRKCPFRMFGCCNFDAKYAKKNVQFDSVLTFQLLHSRPFRRQNCCLRCQMSPRPTFSTSRLSLALEVS